MPITLASEVLRLEEEAERLLETLPPTSPDHETVRFVVVQLREISARLLHAKESTRELIDSSIAQIEMADRMLGELRRDA